MCVCAAVVFGGRLCWPAVSLLHFSFSYVHVSARASLRLEEVGSLWKWVLGIQHGFWDRAVGYTWPLYQRHLALANPY